MKKTFTKIMLLLFALIVGMGNVRAQTTQTFTAGTDTGATSVTKGEATVSMSTMSRDDNYRTYANTDMTVDASNGYLITKVVVTCTGSGTNNYGPGKFSSSDNNYSYSGTTGTWENNDGASNVTLTASAQVRMTEIKVTYMSSGGGGGGSTPTITVSKSNITNLNYTGSGPSEAQSFKVSGSNLGQTDITLALNNGASSKFEISKAEGSGYTNTLTLEPSNGSVSETTIYVRLKSGQSVSAEAYTDRINLSSSTALATVNLSGTVTPPSFTWDLTKAQFSSQSSDLVTWTNTHATMTCERNGSNFAANAYLGGTNSYTNTHFYTNHILTISPVPHWAISKIEITATSTTYATTISNATWSNATVSVSGSVVTVTPSNGDLDVSATFGGTVYVTGVVVYYAESTATFYSITVNGSLNGSVVANYNEAIAGKTITLSVYPDAGYCIEASNISASGATVTKVNAATCTYTMPANNVTVSATFSVYDGTYYTLVTSTDDLIPGRKYIIASSKTNGAAYAMGAQSNTNYRSQVDAVVAGTMIYETTGVAEIVLSGDATNHWTMYDENTPGYLYAASSNYLKTQNSLASIKASEWSVSITNDGDASIVSYITTQNVSNTIRHNPGSTRFSCYTPTNTMAPVYLYMKANETTCKFYSATKIAKEVDCATCNLSHANATLTIADGGILNCSGTITGATTTKLIVEDGGQLITANNASVNATVKKSVLAWNDTDKEGWNAISSPVNGQSFSDVANMQPTGDKTHNIYLYDPANVRWQEYRNNEAGVTSYSAFTNGRGYLYRKNNNTTIEFSGALNTGNVTYSSIYYDKDDVLKQYNLIGNPYAHNITKGSSSANILNGDILESKYCIFNSNGTWTLKGDGTAIAPGTAILVQAKKSGSITITNAAGSKGETANNDNIWFTVAGNEFKDVACVEFKNGHGFNKIAHRNEDAPMLYINHKGENFASVDMDDDTKVINLCFKSNKMGLYTLTYNAKGVFSYLHLIDKITGEDVDMLIDDEYTFVGTPSDKEDRFIVKLAYLPDYGIDGSDTFAFQSGNEIFVSGQGELQIFDVTGRFVMSERINGVNTINADALSKGVYVLRIVGSEIKTQKIIIK